MLPRIPALPMSGELRTAAAPELPARAARPGASHQLLRRRAEA